MIMRNQNHRREQIIRELVFELGIPEAKFLIAVCDGPKNVDEIVRDLDAKLSKKGRRSTSISPLNSKTSLPKLLLKAVRDAEADAVHVTGISSLPKKQLLRFLSELNFQRDVLTHLGLPIVIWISKNQVQQLAASAPDFWSRRHGVYSFDSTSVESLLGRIFSRRSKIGQPGHPNRDISRSLSDVLAAERELRGCLQHRSQFSLGKADGLIQKIRKGVDQLLAAGRKGRQIEIAMWLWNISRLDQDLQQVAQSADSASRNVYEALYTDRNEVLLHMAEGILDILSNYSDGLDETIRNKGKISVLSIYVETAARKLSEMARVLTVEHVSLDDLLAPLPEVLGDKQSQGWANDEFRATAAHQLELWLSGARIERPRMFSENEGKMLRALYDDPERPDLAGLLGLSPDKLDSKISALEAKVRLYLGLGPIWKGAARGMS
jgi:hypothetical protein